MRESYQVRYLMHDLARSPETWVVRAISNIVNVSAVQPLQAHLSLTRGSPSEMQIRWVSGAVDNASVVIREKSAPISESRTLRATSSTYDTSHMCGGLASIVSPQHFRCPGLIHTVIAQDLKPDTRYCYVLGSTAQWSAERAFRTPSLDKRAAFTFAMYGDQVLYPGTLPVSAELEKQMDDHRSGAGNW